MQLIKPALTSLRPAFFLAVIFLSCCNGEPDGNPDDTSSAAIGPNGSAVEILEAVEKRVLHVKATSDPGDDVELELESLYSEPIEVKLGPGYFAKCLGYKTSHDKLLVGSGKYKLSPRETVKVKITGYSMSYFPEPPAGSKLEFNLEKLRENSAASQLVGYLVENKDVDAKTAKVAVWAVAEKMSFEELRNLRKLGTGQGGVTGKDYFNAIELLREAGVKPENLKFDLDIEKAVLNAIEKLGNGSRSECVDAISFLGWFYGMEKPVGALLELMEENDDPLLRQKAAEALAGSGLKSVKEAFLLTLELDSSRTVRRAAAFSLILAGEVAAVPLAIMFLGDEDIEDSMAEQVSAKLSGLAGNGKPEWKSKEWEVWWLTSAGWAWLDSKGADTERIKEIMSAQHRFYREPGIEAVSGMSSSELAVVLDWLRKLHTTEGRKSLDDDAVFERVLDLGRETSNASVALNIAWILRDVKDSSRKERSLRVLLVMLSKKENRAAYRDVISVLEYWKAKEAVETLVYMLDDKQYSEIAARALRTITGQELDGSDREKWQKLLEKHGGGIREKFIKRLKESDGDELTQVLSDLGSNMYKKLWKDKGIFEELLSASEKIDKWEQVNAYAYLLSRNKEDSRAQKTLMEMVTQIDDLESKRVLITSLVQNFTNGETVDFLLELLDTGKGRLKMAIRQALYDVTGASTSKRLRSKSDWLQYFSEHPGARWGKGE